MSVAYDYKVRTSYTDDVPRLRAAHKVIAEVPFTPSMPDKGYTRRTLFLDLDTMTVKEKPITEEMIDIFTGGRGFGMYYLWHAVTPETKWNDPDNELIISPGPVAGNPQYAGSGKSLVVSLSPMTGIPIDCNVGGYFGPFLKFCGFDALEIRGKARNDVVVFIDGPKGLITVEEAPEETPDSHIAAELFTHMYAADAKDLVNVSVVSAGKAAESVYMGCLNFSWYDPKRGAVRLKQAGRGGTGTVFRDKRLKALVIRSPKMGPNHNNAADLPAVIKVGRIINQEIHDHDDEQCHMRRQGTAHLVEVMDAYDLLPVYNFQYGKHPDTHKIDSQVWDRRFTQAVPDRCWYGCGMACSKGADGHVVRTGPYKGHIVTVDGPEYENVGGLASNCGLFDPDWLLEVNFYCDTYGIDTISYGTACAFVMECWEKGILNAERTGGIDLAWGNGESEVEMLHQMWRGEGFGVTVGKGVRYMQNLFIANGWGDAQFIRDIGMQIKGLEISQYMSKESLAQQGGYALANKGPQHDEAWLIFMDMVNNQIPTFEDKAEALHYFPVFRTWFGLQGLCKLPWNDIEPPDNHEKYPGPEAAKVPAHVDNYLALYTGITGRPLDRKSLLEQSERVYNFQRVFNLRMGQGVREFDMPPYRAMGPVTNEEYESRAERYDAQLKDLVGIDPAGKTTAEKVKLHRQWRTDRYNKLVDAVYVRRGWSPNGVPTMETLKKLRIDFPEVVEVVRPHLG